VHGIDYRSNKMAAGPFPGSHFRLALQPTFSTMAAAVSPAAQPAKRR
jgi:hypothetical protein